MFNHKKLKIMSKLKKLSTENVSLKKSEMATIKGGTSETQYTQTGYAEMEQEVDSSGNKIGDPQLVDFPG
jgi:hypothetical protein